MLASLIVGIKLNPIWIVVGALFSVERVVIETAYDLFLQAVQARVYVDVLFRRRKEW